MPIIHVCVLTWKWTKKCVIFILDIDCARVRQSRRLPNQTWRRVTAHHAPATPWPDGPWRCHNHPKHVATHGRWTGEIIFTILRSHVPGSYRSFSSHRSMSFCGFHLLITISLFTTENFLKTSSNVFVAWSFFPRVLYRLNQLGRLTQSLLVIREVKTISQLRDLLAIFFIFSQTTAS